MNAGGELSAFAGSLVLVGAGNMGGAMLQGWLALGLDPKRVTVVEPNPSAAIAKLVGEGLTLNPGDDRRARADVLVCAVKPQSAAEAIAELGAFVAEASLFVSIMAGKTIGSLAAALPAGTAVVRAMPNTPAAIGRGITVALGNERVSASQRELAHALLGAVGAVEWVEDEALLDPVTAVSGSGPAYVFLLAEGLARAGVSAGLPPELAARLARETIAGAGELLHRSDLPAEQLRRNVTSPGGTTAAALQVLMGPEGFDRLLQEAVEAATRRSRELAG